MNASGDGNRIGAMRLSARTLTRPNARLGEAAVYLVPTGARRGRMSADAAVSGSCCRDVENFADTACPGTEV